MFSELVNNLLMPLHKAANTFHPQYRGEKISLLHDETEYKMDVAQFVAENLEGDFKIASDFLERQNRFKNDVASDDVVIDPKKFYEKYQLINKDFYLFVTCLMQLPAYVPSIHIEDLFQEEKNESVTGLVDE